MKVHHSTHGKRDVMLTLPPSQFCCCDCGFSKILAAQRNFYCPPQSGTSHLSDLSWTYIERFPACDAVTAMNSSSEIANWISMLFLIDRIIWPPEDFTSSAHGWHQVAHVNPPPRLTKVYILQNGRRACSREKKAAVWAVVLAGLPTFQARDMSVAK